MRASQVPLVRLHAFLVLVFTGEWPLLACPSVNLGSLLNGLNTILLGVMAILRHQTKADMHENAAKNLQYRTGFQRWAPSSGIGLRSTPAVPP